MPQGQFSIVLSLIGSILLFGLVLFLAWFCTRWISKRFGLRTAAGGSKIKMLDRMALGADRSLVVVRLEDRVWLLGVTAHHVSKIDELDPEIFTEEELSQEEGSSHGVTAILSGSSNFAAALKNALKGRTSEKKNEKDKFDE